MTSKIERAFAKGIMVDMRAKGTLCFPVEVFEKMIQELKNQILEGELDTLIHLTTEKLIYDKMSETFDKTLNNLPSGSVVLKVK